LNISEYRCDACGHGMQVDDASLCYERERRPEGGFVDSNFAIVHSDGCIPEIIKTSGNYLTWYMGPAGLDRLLRHVRYADDVDAFCEVIRRVQIPGYEQGLD
jgi:hypothetical protein